MSGATEGLLGTIECLDDKAACAHKVVVRLATSCWRDTRGALHTRKSLTPLRRMSVGHDMLMCEADNIGADQTVQMIVNLYTCEDGIYELITCNERRDYETGHIDAYDFKLVEFDRTPPKET